MNIITTTALANLRKNKSRNILIGIAIALTAFLLTMLPTVVMGNLSLEFEAVNELYSPVHGVYRNVDDETADRMAQDETFEAVGLREQAGRMYFSNKDIVASMLCFDETALELSKMELEEGKFPEKADEIVVSPGCLKAMGLEGNVGDRIKVPYQPMRKGKFLEATEREFTITGMTEDTPEALEKGFFAPMVSEAFAKETIPEGEHAYEVYFQLRGIEGMPTDKIEERIKLTGERYGISEVDTAENTEYLTANYVDTVLYTGLGVLLASIVLAGILTFYSIFDVSLSDQVKEDGKLDLSIREKSYLQIGKDVIRILDILEKYDGVLPFNDKASPETIRREMQMSKNEFKRAVGHLLKEGKITITEKNIRLN